MADQAVAKNAVPARKSPYSRGQRRQFRHVVKTRPDQEKQLQAMAASLGVTVSRLLLDSTLQGSSALSVQDSRELGGELLAIRRTLQGLGTNLNQVARIANSTGEVPEGQVSAISARSLVAIERLNALLVKVAGR